MFAIIGVSIFALGLFYWLKLINANIRAVIFGVLVISVSFKMTEILRFPNAVHTAAWYPWILYGLTRIILSRSVRDAVISAALLCFFLICFCTAGYPYYVYYSVFLFVPYLFVFLIRPLRAQLVGAQPVCWRRVVIALTIVGFITGIICIPYLSSIKNLMAQVADRSGRNYEYSVWHQFSFEDTVGSLVYPPAAQSEGWYFFSITALLIILLYLFTKSADKSPSGSYFSREITVKIFFVLWVGIISYISYGKNSYLFTFLWKYMPGFSSLRTWGRLNIILLPILAWLLSLAFNRFENIIFDSVQMENKGFCKKNQVILTLVLSYVIILCIQLYLILNKVYDIYWKEYLRLSSYNTLWFLYLGSSAFVVILLILIVAGKFVLKSVKVLTIIVFLLIISAVFEMWPIGTHTWTYTGKSLNGRMRLDVDRINQASFDFSRIDGRDSISLTPVFNAGILPNWYFDRYVKFLEKNSDNLQARKILLGVIGKQRVFFSMSIDYKTIEDFLNDSLQYKNHGHLLSYTGDELQWQIQAPVSGYISFIDNWDKGWKAFVDGQEAKIELLFGTFKSVAVKEGYHQIKFIYKPGLFIL